MSEGKKIKVKPQTTLVVAIVGIYATCGCLMLSLVVLCAAILGLKSEVPLSKSSTIALILNEPFFATEMALVSLTSSAVLSRNIRSLERLQIVNTIYLLLSMGLGLFLLISIFRGRTRSGQVEHSVAVAMAVVWILQIAGIFSVACLSSEVERPEISPPIQPHTTAYAPYNIEWI
ncbi:hypothetical protein B0H14DRAFT_1175691 [Mycena olivaceomarginata]|nr:hypothetical protein B0H14DRAFT_1175691 [Mycena olivaceomarginata]